MINRSLSSHIYQLQYRLQEAIIYQVSDDFVDITSTIKTLREAALLPPSNSRSFSFEYRMKTFVQMIQIDTNYFRQLFKNISRIHLR